jgi:hypothetical protein
MLNDVRKRAKNKRQTFIERGIVASAEAICYVQAHEF